MIQAIIYQRILSPLVILALALVLLVGFGQIGSAQTNPFANLPAETQECVKKVLGETRYSELSAGAQFTESDSTTVGSSGCFANKTVVGGSTVTPTKVNPFENLNDTHKQCVKDALGQARFNALAAGEAFTEQDQQIVSKTTCVYQTYQGPTGVQGENREEFKPDPEVETCVEQALGAKRFAQLKSGGQPSPGEMEKAEPCFAKQKDKYVKEIRTDKDFSAFEKCFKLVIGADRFEQMKTGKAQVSITSQEREKAYQCMGKDPHPVAPSPEMKMSANLEKCLKAAIGEERFSTVSKGEDQPSSEEQTKGEACFKSEYGKNKTAFKPEQVLPPDPKQVPFVKEASDVKVEDVKIVQDKTEISGEATKAKEGEVVDVYVYSGEPKQISTTAGKDGSFKVSYDGKLDEGSHRVYALVRSLGEAVRSAAKTFTTQEAQAATTKPKPAIQTQSQTGDQGVDLMVYYLASAAGALVALLLILVLARRRT